MLQCPLFLSFLSSRTFFLLNSLLLPTRGHGHRWYLRTSFECQVHCSSCGFAILLPGKQIFTCGCPGATNHKENFRALTKAFSKEYWSCQATGYIVYTVSFVGSSLFVPTIPEYIISTQTIGYSTKMKCGSGQTETLLHYFQKKSKPVKWQNYGSYASSTRDSHLLFCDSGSSSSDDTTDSK